MGSNSSSVQQQAIQNIETNLGAEASATQTQLCGITDVTIISTCPVQIVQTCNASLTLDSNAVLDQTAQAAYDSVQQQQSAMFSFLNFNSSTTKQEIDQYLSANLSNKCESIQNTQVVISRVYITVTARPCVRSVKIYNNSQAETQCTLTTTMNVFSNADLNATTTQKTGGLGLGGSTGDESCAYFLLILVGVMLLLGVVMLFFFRHKKNQEGAYSQAVPRGPSDDSSGTIQLDAQSLKTYAKLAKLYY